MQHLIQQKALFFNLKTGVGREEIIQDENIIGPVDFGFKNKDKLVIGTGVLAGSIIPGTRRLMFTGPSPVWGNFYISTMGGAALIFHKTSLNYLVLEEAAPQISILKINYQDGKLLTKLEPVVDVERLWQDYKGKKGTYALQQYIYDNYGKEFKECRILSVGPASQKTVIGAILSIPLENGEFNNVDTWAGRGGMGSLLFQRYKLAGIIYGGDYSAQFDFRNLAEINEFFEKNFHKKMMIEDMEATEKYRYNPAFNTGGTFGVNFARLKDAVIFFNWQSVYLDDAERLKVHEDFIVNHYIKQFNEEIIVPKKFKHCGEPCPAVCKKMHGEYKKDYEPYESLGPNCGIFDQRAAERTNKFADTLGFDAIQIGNTVSWLMECIVKNKFPKEDFGLKLVPKFDLQKFDVILDSDHNADCALEIMKMILSDKTGIFRQDIRNAAKALDKKYQTDTINLAAFTAFQGNGCMAPNQYWVPGMFSPMPIMGKYFEYYGEDYLAPRELGKKNAERMVKELYNDNSGCCRFHRQWAETIIGEIICKHYGVNIDYYKHHLELCKNIYKTNQPVFWESERVVDIIFNFLLKKQLETPNNEDINKWIGKFKEDKWKAAKEYWGEIKKGVEEVFR